LSSWNELLAIRDPSATAIVFLSFITPEWLSAAEALRLELLTAGKKVLIVDASAFTFPRRVSTRAPSNIIKLKSHDSFNSTKITYQNVIADAVWNSVKSLARETELSQDKYLFRFMASRIESRALSLIQSIEEISMGLGGERFSEVFIPNGRFPNETLLTHLAGSIAKSTFYWELWGPNQYFVTPHPVHAWSSQASILSDYIGSNLGDESKLAWTQGWLTKRSSVQNNSFAKFWSAGSEVENATQTGPLLAVFPSSSDEVGSIDKSELHELDNQSVSMRKVISRAHQIGYNVTVRLHPNLLTKPRREFSRELKVFSKIAKDFPGVQVLKPDSRVNSYKLIAESDIVYVHGSSIGVEASALGKPVLSSQRSAYSLVTDVIELLSDSDLSVLELTPPLPDRRKSLLYLEWIHRHRIRYVPPNLQHSRSVPGLMGRGRAFFSAGLLDAIFTLWLILRWKPVTFLRKLKAQSKSISKLRKVLGGGAYVPFRGNKRKDLNT
jgi:hypothetical protein